MRPSTTAPFASNTGEIAIWPVKLGTSAVEAAKAALDKWVRVTWTNTSKSYSVQPATEKHANPEWRYASFDQLAEIAFAGRILGDSEDAVVKEILTKKASGK